MITVLLFCCLHYLFTEIYQLKQSFRGKSEYNHIRKDGVWGKAVALVGWILVNCCIEEEPV